MRRGARTGSCGLVGGAKSFLPSRHSLQRVPVCWPTQRQVLGAPAQVPPTRLQPGLQTASWHWSPCHSGGQRHLRNLSQVPPLTQT